MESNTSGIQHNGQNNIKAIPTRIHVKADGYVLILVRIFRAPHFGHVSIKRGVRPNMDTPDVVVPVRVVVVEVVLVVVMVVDAAAAGFLAGGGGGSVEVVDNEGDVTSSSIIATAIGSSPVGMFTYPVFVILLSLFCS